ncbi:holin family protein [Mucilaginibacter gracilis]|uniref:Holin family protein n=1 Tax=Mucilaginibacter gracilis TaxID=423350 RepID=A0A495J102_9SPHI|nr:phage holin family protein [Mucilaginibacter gracilis]RKR82666.1 holin family protein [Mucilaginibacter gracilis]
MKTLTTKYKMNYLTNFLNGLWSFAGKYAMLFLVFLTPVHPLLYTIYILLVCDLITGITKAVKIKEAVTSKRMRDSVIKFVFYSIAVFIAFQVDITLFSATALYLARLVGGYIILIEFQSNIENISTITGIDLWVMIKDKVMSFFDSKLKESKGDKTNA